MAPCPLSRQSRNASGRDGESVRRDEQRLCGAKNVEHVHGLRLPKLPVVRDSYRREVAQAGLIKELKHKDYY
jgi:hypothetical protein